MLENCENFMKAVCSSVTCVVSKIINYNLYSVSYGSNPVGWAYNLVFGKTSLISLIYVRGCAVLYNCFCY